MTGLWVRVGHHLVLVGASKLTCFLCEWPKLTSFQCGGWNLTFAFSVGMKSIWLLRGLSKLIWFQCRHRNWLGFLCGCRKWHFCARIKCGGWNLTFEFSVGMKSIWLLLGLSDFYLFQCRDRNWLGFCVAVENDIFVSGSKLTRFLCRGIDKSTWC